MSTKGIVDDFVVSLSNGKLRRKSERDDETGAVVQPRTQNVQSFAATANAATLKCVFCLTSMAPELPSLLGIANAIRMTSNFSGGPARPAWQHLLVRHEGGRLGTRFF
jgi:hypothetical protein